MRSVTKTSHQPQFWPVLSYIFPTQGGIKNAKLLAWLILICSDFLPTGLKESSIMSHADSVLLAEVEDEVRKQIGVVYSQDSS